MSPELLLAGVILAALVIYSLSGGADFGGGVWDLFATGPRAREQRETIAKAIGPIWEANHVWLIFVIVMLFSCFPKAYSTIGTALHIPLTIMLFGIILRGTAFVFRTYDSQRDAVHRRWSLVFSVSSVVTPLMLGICLGAAASGQIRHGADGRVETDFVSSWLAPFPIAVGCFSVAVFAFLAAVYLTNETDDPALQDDFRLRAFGATAAVTVLAWVCFFLAGEGAPRIQEGLSSGGQALVFQGVTGLIGIAIVWALYRRRFPAARLLAMTQVFMLIVGVGAAQFPYIVAPDITFWNAAAPRSVLVIILGAIAIGGGPLLLAYAYLLKVFKQNPEHSVGQ